MDIGKWFTKDIYNLHDMLKALRKERIDILSPTKEERERFVWRESLVMVKKNGNVHINKMTEEKEEYLKQFKKKTKKHKQQTFNNND